MSLKQQHRPRLSEFLASPTGQALMDLLADECPEPVPPKGTSTDVSYIAAIS